MTTDANTGGGSSGGAGGAATTTSGGAGGAAPTTKSIGFPSSYNPLGKTKFKTMGDAFAHKGNPDMREIGNMPDVLADQPDNFGFGADSKSHAMALRLARNRANEGSALFSRFTAHSFDQNNPDITQWYKNLSHAQQQKITGGGSRSGVNGTDMTTRYKDAYNGTADSGMTNQERHASAAESMAFQERPPAETKYDPFSPGGNSYYHWDPETGEVFEDRPPTIHDANFTMHHNVDGEKDQGDARFELAMKAWEQKERGGQSEEDYLAESGDLLDRRLAEMDRDPDRDIEPFDPLERALRNREDSSFLKERQEEPGPGSLTVDRGSSELGTVNPDDFTPKPMLSPSADTLPGKQVDSNFIALDYPISNPRTGQSWDKATQQKLLDADKRGLRLDTSTWQWVKK